MHPDRAGRSAAQRPLSASSSADHVCMTPRSCYACQCMRAALRIPARRVFPASEEDLAAAAKGDAGGPGAGAAPTQRRWVLRLRGLPFSAGPDEVIDFFGPDHAIIGGAQVRQGALSSYQSRLAAAGCAGMRGSNCCRSLECIFLAILDSFHAELKF